MRKYIILLVAAMFLVACGNDENELSETETDEGILIEEDSEMVIEYEELEDFITNYNKEVERFDDYEEDLPEVVTIKQSDIDTLNEVDEGFVRSLLKYDFEKSSGYYEIFAIYNSDEQLYGYRLTTQSLYKNNDEFVSIDDRGKVASAVMADALGLDIDNYYDNLNNLLNKDKSSGSYDELEYAVEFSLDSKSDIMTVDFNNEEHEHEDEVDTNEEVKEDKVTEEDEEQSDDNTNDIDWDVNNIVDSDLDNTTITDLRINEDASVDEERYIVLVDLEWDVKNKPNTTKDMLDMYSDHLAAKLSDNEMIYELVLFWTVPYHNENESILKRTYENQNEGMFLEDEIKDITVFD